MQNSKNGVHEGQKSYTCLQCDKTFGNIEEIKQHTTMWGGLCGVDHNNDFVASELNETDHHDTSAVDITEHKIKEEMIERKTLKKSVNCQFCDQPFESEKILQKHVQEDHGVNPPPVTTNENTIHEKITPNPKRIKLENVNEKIILHQNPPSVTKERQHFKKRKLPAVSVKSEKPFGVEMEKNINEVTDNDDIVVLESDDDKENEMEGCEQEILGI